MGTWQVSDEDAESAVTTALAIGYRHIDTAVGYGNECGVGRGIKASGIEREQIYITSKIPAEVKDYEDAKKVIEQSLERLGVEYLDLMLIHAPRPWSEMYPEAPNRYYEENPAVWKAMEEAYRAGKIKAIGVSNFEVDDLKNLLSKCEIKPMANQIRIHIGHTPKDVMSLCETEGIQIEAYSPIFTGRLLENAEVAFEISAEDMEVLAAVQV
uniref:aldo/keto reductase n=1 Tax=Acetatifactor sp. TaxID=1872090 RepID=UPI0040579AF4